jgi:hypothetical protein
MTAQQWLKSEVKYGRKVLHAGIEGTRSGQEAFLNGRRLTPFLNDSVCRAFIPAAIGTCNGVAGSLTRKNRSVGRVLAAASLGGAIGFAAGIAWESRGLTGSAVRGALKRIDKVRDEHWFERNPIAYA